MGYHYKGHWVASWLHEVSESWERVQCEESSAERSRVEYEISCVREVGLVLPQPLSRKANLPFLVSAGQT